MWQTLGKNSKELFLERGIGNMLLLKISKKEPSAPCDTNNIIFERITQVLTLINGVCFDVVVKKGDSFSQNATKCVLNIALLRLVTQ